MSFTSCGNTTRVDTQHLYETFRRMPPTTMPLDDADRDRLEQLHTALISDVMDEMGMDDNVLPHEIRPVLSGQHTVVGTAHTVQMVSVGYESEGHFEQILETIETIDPGDILVRAAPEGVSVGLWGELLSVAARSKGAVGAIIDGPTRDSDLIEDVGFPVWARGNSIVDSYGRVDTLDIGVPIVIGDARIHTSDVIVADTGGIIRVPSDAIREVIERAEEKESVESTVREELEAGRSFEDVYREHHTL